MKWRDKQWWSTILPISANWSTTPQTTEHKQDYKIWRWKLRSSIRTGISMCLFKIWLQKYYGYGYGVRRQFQQYFSYIVAVSFIGGRNRSTQISVCPWIFRHTSVMEEFTQIDKCSAWRQMNKVEQRITRKGNSNCNDNKKLRN